MRRAEELQRVVPVVGDPDGFESQAIEPPLEVACDQRFVFDDQDPGPGLLGPALPLYVIAAQEIRTREHLCVSFFQGVAGGGTCAPRVAECCQSMVPECCPPAETDSTHLAAVA